MWEDIISAITDVNGSINTVVWGIPMLLLIICTGIYITVRTGFFQVFYAKIVANETFLAIFKKKSITRTKDKNAISQFQALSTALAATIGTGNIAGVATAITIGGAGAVFWMWFSAFFGMMTNYAENVLGIYFRKKNLKDEWSGGAMYYIEEGFKNKKGLKYIAKPLAVLFSVFCVLASFGIGNMSQVNSIASAMSTSFNIPEILTGLILAIVAGLVIIGGIRRIAQVTEKIVPFMAIAYIIATLIIVIMNITHIPSVISQIFKEAFGFNAITGGFSGILLKQAITMGFKRGVFSNEAGLGSSVIVHSASDVKEPVIQGMWGIFEVFFDTIIVCSLTAFTILSTGVVGSVDASGSAIMGVALVNRAFATSFHGIAGAILSIAVLLFAFSTVLGWSFYGAKALEYMLGIKATIIYKIVFIIFIVFGATMNLSLAWDISDTLNGLMAIPNLIGVLILSGTVIKITQNYLVRKRKKNPDTIEPMISFYKNIQKEQVDAMKAEEQK